MQKIKNRKKSLALRFLVLTAILFFAFFVLEQYAVTASECDQLTGADKDKCEALERKAEAYRDLIEIKNKQQTTLEKQIENIDAEQAKTQAALQDTQREALSLDEQIRQLEREIGSKEEQVKYQKAILVGLIRSYYEDFQAGMTDIMILDSSFYDAFSQDDYVQQASSRAKDILASIQQAKRELETQQSDLESKHEASLKLKEKLEDQKSDLQSTENQKSALLTQTQGEEQKYQELLARVEQQKQELFNFNSAGNLAEVDASVNDYPRPKDHLASTSWYYSQRDSRWASKKIGNSNSTIGDYGCALTSVSMVFTYYGTSISPATMAKQKIYYYDLIKWPSSWPKDIELVSSISHGNINWKTIDSEIAKDHPVIVYIKKTNGRGGHYVVIHNKDKKDYIVHDPYFGSNLYLGTSRALVGKIGNDSKTSMDQMIIYH